MEGLLALSTFPDREIALRIVTDLVGKNLVACGNILPDVQSVYRWQGKVETASEVLVLFKLSGGAYEDFEKELRSLHPYDVPEIIAFRIERGSEDYLRWVGGNCAGAG